MPSFLYQAMDGQGRRTQGELSADSRAVALSQLAERGLAPLSLQIKEAAAPAAAPIWNWRLGRNNKVPAAQVEAFSRELANLLAAGVPLARALHVLRREASHPAAKIQWSAVHDDVVGGKPLSESLARWPRSFPQVYVAMVAAGETGGFLDVVLNQIADFRARESELVGKVKSAMVYPIVLACLAVLVLIFLLTFFIPQFSGMFAEFGANLPWLTVAIVGVSKWMTHYGIILAVLAVGLIIAIHRSLATQAGRRLYERICLKTPGLGAVMARFALVRFSRMLGTLLGAGVPLVTALRVAREAIGNQTLSDAVATSIQDVKEGASLAQSLATCPQLFPASVTEMIAVAEESGRLDKELLRMAQYSENDLDRKLRMLVALAEPLLLFIMASLIGTIVIGMLLPIFTLQELIK